VNDQKTEAGVENRQNGDVHVVRQAEFNNYLSIGVDAQIIHSFHDHREHHRKLYCGRCCNMAWMTCFGALNFIGCQARALKIKLEIPDSTAASGWKELAIPKDIKAIILLNLETYAGGRRIWGKTSKQSGKNEYQGSVPTIEDGLLEVVGVANSVHLGRMLVNCSRGIRLAQVHEIKITSSAASFVQLDGEPWEEAASTYHIRRLHQAVMIDNTKH